MPVKPVGYPRDSAQAKAMSLLTAALLALVALSAVSSSADAACTRSTLKGYNYSVPLDTRSTTGR